MPVSPSPRAVVARTPAPGLFVFSGLAQYLGAALAVGLFADLAAPAVAWLRVLVAALVLVVWRRPWRMPWTRRDVLGVVLFGLALGGMNVSFYIAIDHLPLGTAVAIEFIGPVAVAAVTGVTWRERAGVGLAAVGVALLAGVTLTLGGSEARLGLVAIVVAAAFWAAYIIIGRRIALRGDGVTRLSVAMTVAALVLAPALAAPAAPVLGSWRLVAAVVGVGVLSSVLPYVVEQIVLRRVSAASFAVLLAMLPATAAAVGALALRQLPHVLDVAGLVLVSAAIVLTTRRRQTDVEPPPS